jgi:hypothetical protein
MNLQIRDPMVRRKAEELARLQGTTMTKAVGDAVAEKLSRMRGQVSVSEAAHRARIRLNALSRGPGHDMTKDEIDAMWGQ